MGRFTVIPENTFNALQLDAGVLLKKFDPANPVAPADEDIICATTGGITAACVPTFSDLGEDVDNVPVNMKELKHLDSWECTITTTSLGTSPELIQMALGCADIDGSDKTKIIPRAKLSQTDFTDIWWVGDRADGGLVAVRLMNALSTGGFSLQTTKNGKGQISLTITGHVSIKKQDVIPMVFYSADPEIVSPVTMEAVDGSAVLFDTPVSEMQTGINVHSGYITGTLHFIEGGIAQSGPLAGDGHFIALQFSDLDPDATSIKVGLDPSEGTGLVEIINDPDKNGVFKVTNKNTQEFKIVSTDGEHTITQTFKLDTLTLDEE